ncbi:MAG: glycan-binding surface protein [Bacteroidales bacterium]|nr:glycan-binding surface protein [Bacteroidales bacterium]
MKKYISKIAFYAAATLTLAFGFTACEDEPDKFELAGGKPTIYYIRPVNVEAADSLLTGAYMGNSICIVGDNLRSVYKMVFNDQEATLNNSYITDNTILVDVPNEIPGEVSDLIYFITKDRDTVKYEFSVLVPGPVISSMSCEYAAPGTVATLYGDYFVDDPNVPLKLFVGDVEATVKNVTKGAIDFVVPDVEESNIRVTNIYGEAKSAFHYKDTRGLLFDFDGVTGLGNHGWHAQVIESDETSITGKFLRLGGADVTLSEDGGWDDSHFSFEYWPGQWTTPQEYTGDGILLTDLADFSDWENMSLKFEFYVPKSNPWMAGSMQIVFAGRDKVTLAGGLDVFGDEVPGANNSYFNGKELPRGLYTPWYPSGSFDTGDEWITVTVPFTNFIYGSDGTVATGKLTASDFTSLLIFVWSGGYTGTECHPILKLDNIRAVPNK